MKITRGFSSTSPDLHVYTYLRSSLSNSTAAILFSQSASPGSPSTFSHARNSDTAGMCLGTLPYMDS